MRNDMVPLAERLRYMQLFRLACACLLVVTRLLLPDIAPVSMSDALTVTGLYLSVSVVSELLWRAWRGRGLLLFGGMLLTDGLFLSWMAHVTGDGLSPLRYLVLLHIIVVTLLASYRTGLKLAVWHSLLFFVVYYAQQDGHLGGGDGAQTIEQLSAFIASFWLVALGTATFSAINERELRRRRIDLEALAAMANQLEQTIQPNDVAQAVIDHLGDNFGFERACLLAAAVGDPVLMAHRGLADAASSETGVDAVVRRAGESREPLLLRGLDRAENPRLTALLPGANNLVIVPLLATGRSIGVIVVEHAMRHGSRIEHRVVSMVSQFAAHAALALDNSWLLEKVQKLAQTDGLTMIANRRAFDATLAREVERAARTGEELSLVLLDIDHFKKLNDTHGHQAGDDVLRVVAAALAGRVRDYDLVARYGGEEFVAVLPHCPTHEALEMAERLRAAMSAADTLVPVTASAGVATYPAHGGSAAALLAAADEALYASKRAGRDRATLSDRETAPRMVRVVS